jgi:hypothetical protein
MLARVLKHILIFALVFTFILTGCSTEEIIGKTSVPAQVKLTTDPVFSHDSGSYKSPFTLTITNNTKDAVIYYTVNGSNPKTDKSSVLTGVSPVNVKINSDTTVQAYAVSKDLLDSNVIKKQYKLTSIPVVDDPVITVTSSNPAISKVDITCSTAGATIIYTTDNSDPKTSATSDKGTSPVSIKVSTGNTVKAYAIKTGMSESNVVNKQAK